MDTEELETHKRRLALLKRRAAVEGIRCDPAVLIEIEDIERKLTQSGVKLPTHRSFRGVDNQWLIKDIPRNINIKSTGVSGWINKVNIVFMVIVGIISTYSLPSDAGNIFVLPATILTIYMLDKLYHFQGCAIVSLSLMIVGAIIVYVDWSTGHLPMSDPLLISNLSIVANIGLSILVFGGLISIMLIPYKLFSWMIVRSIKS